MWWDIVKFQKYTLLEVKNLFLNRDTIDRKFKDGSPTLIELYLFYLIYFEKPLPTKIRMECKKFASKANDTNTATFLNNLSIAGGKIIQSDRVLPFSDDEVKPMAVSAKRKGTNLSNIHVDMKIYLHVSDIYHIDLTASDGLYYFELRKINPNGYLQVSTLESNIPFIKKVLDKYDTRVSIIKYNEMYSSWIKSETNLEEIKDVIEMYGDEYQ